MLTTLGLDISNFTAGFQQATQTTEKFHSKVKQHNESIKESFKEMSSEIITSLTGAFAVEKIMEFGKECSETAMKAEGIQQAFARLNNASILNELRAAVKGTISDMNLEKIAVKAKSLGIPFKDLGVLLEFAHQKSKDLGLDINEVSEKIISGIGKKAVKSFSELGISSLELKKTFGEIDPELMSVAEVSKKVAEIAENSFKGVGESVETTAEKVEGLKASMKNYMVSIGSGLNSVLGKIVDVSKDAFNQLDALMSSDRLTTWQKSMRMLSLATGINSGKWDAYTGNIANEQQSSNKTTDINNQDYKQRLEEKIHGLTSEADKTNLLAKQEEGLLYFIQQLENQKEYKGFLNKAESQELMKYNKELKTTQTILDDVRQSTEDGKKASEIKAAADKANAEKQAEAARKKAEAMGSKGSVKWLETSISDLTELMNKSSDPQLIGNYMIKISDFQKSLNIAKSDAQNLIDVLSGDIATKDVDTAKNDKSWEDQINSMMKSDLHIKAPEMPMPVINPIKVKGFIQDTKGMLQQMNEVVKQGIENMIKSMGQGIADLITDGAGRSWKKFFSGILSTIGDFLKEMGAAVMAYGVAMDAFKKAFSGNAWAAIAAGAALILTGAVVSNLATKIGSNWGGTDNWQGGLTMVGERGPELLNVSKGSSIINNGNTKSLLGALGGGNGGSVEFIIRGSNLVGVLNNHQRKVNSY
jgi:hypothetical protein